MNITKEESETFADWLDFVMKMDAVVDSAYTTDAEWEIVLKVSKMLTDHLRSSSSRKPEKHPPGNPGIRQAVEEGTAVYERLRRR